MTKQLHCNNYNVASLTDKGLLRTNNEDAILIDHDLRLFAVADGMGGHGQGDLASRESMKVLQQFLRLCSSRRMTGNYGLRLFKHFFQKRGCRDYQDYIADLNEALFEVNKHIYHLNLENNKADGYGMGTTIAGFWMVSARVCLIFHIGDSRVYRFRDGHLQAMTRDHSMLQEWLDKGANGAKPKANILCNAIGLFSEVTAEIQMHTIIAGDYYLLCTDGLSGQVDDTALATVLGESLEKDSLESCCQQLVRLSLASGGDDNVSVVLLNLV